MGKVAISHSCCGMGNHKSISSADSKEKGREQLSLSLSPSLSHPERERERERGMVYEKSSSSHSDCGANNYKQVRNPIKSKMQTRELNSVGSGGPLESHSRQSGKVYGSISHSG